MIVTAPITLSAGHIEAREDETVILHALRVLPEYGGRGYSRQLVEHAIQTARTWEQKTIRLDCIVGNDIPVKYINPLDLNT